MLASYAGELFPALEDLHQEQAASKPSMLHNTDGESVAGTLRESVIFEARFKAEAGYATLDQA